MKVFFRKRVGKLLAVFLGLVLAVGILLGCQALLDPYDNRIAPGVTIGGLELGGLTRREARQALSDAARDTIYSQNLPISLPEETLSLVPYEMGLELDIKSAVRDAFRVGRRQDSTEKALGLLPYLAVDQDALRTVLRRYAKIYDTVLTQPSYRLEGTQPDLSTQQSISSIPCQTIVLTLGLPEAHLDVEAGAAAVLSAYDQGIGACLAGAYGVTLEVPHSQTPEAPDLDAIYQEVSVQPVNDSLNLETYGFDYGSFGYGFDKAAAEDLISQAAYGQTLSIPMVCLEPEILGEGAYFRDVLGTCDTKHNNNENRNNNLRLLCQALDGHVVQPGEEFSYNQVVGERTAERGYLPAPAYSGNRLANAVGGGVCQGSSTLYNCVLLADLEVTFRAAHGGTINYLPLGLDAAVNWGTTDFCFRNNWHFPVMIRAEVADGYVKMKILGTDEKDYYLKLDARSWADGELTRARSYKLKYDKETDELLSKDQISYSTYYPVG